MALKKGKLENAFDEVMTPQEMLFNNETIGAEKAVEKPKAKAKATRKADDPKPNLKKNPHFMQEFIELRNIRLQIVTTASIKEGLEKASKATGRSKNDLVNEALAVYLEGLK